MAKAKDQALKMLKEGMPAAEIAKKLGLSAATVRSWKSRISKKNETQRCTSDVAKIAQRNATPEVYENLAAEVAKNKKLTEAEKDFCLHYSYRPNAARAYRLAYPGTAPATARTMGSRWFARVDIKAEINRLNAIKRENLLAEVAGSEVQLFQIYWDIAFADMTEYAEWGQFEVVRKTKETDETTGEETEKEEAEVINDVRFINSADVDGTLVAEIKKGREGASVKLANRMAALKWLSDYFEMNPADRHRREFDMRKLRIAEDAAGSPEQTDEVVQIIDDL